MNKEDPKSAFAQANGSQATCEACAQWSKRVKHTPYDMLLCAAERNAPGLVQPYWPACPQFVKRENDKMRDGQ